MELFMVSKENIDNMKNFAKDYAYPVALSYTSWILNDCVKNGHKKIYFLARDGYILYEIAKRICKEKKLDIDCRYLYCSRFALRLPSYFFMSEKELDENLFTFSSAFNPMTIFKKINADSEQIKKLSNCLEIEDINKKMIFSEYQEFIKKLKNSKEFTEILQKNSKKAFENAKNYFKQEKLFQDEEVVFVDLGWVGSMQHCLKLLLNQSNYSGKLKGYFFGLFNNLPQSDGEVKTFYFSHNKNKWRKILFNVNVFECMFSANHGMTLYYEKNEQNKFVPVLNEHNHTEMNELLKTQIDEIISQTENNLQNINIETFDYKKEVKKLFALLKKCMVYPTKEICEIFSNYVMCDDTTENYHYPLASKELSKSLKSQMLFPRIFNKLFKRKTTPQPILWTYGVIAYQPKILRPWYRLNIKLVSYLSFTINKK